MIKTCYKKPKYLQALQWTGENYDEVKQFMGKKYIGFIYKNGDIVKMTTSDGKEGRVIDANDGFDQNNIVDFGDGAITEVKSRELEIVKSLHLYIKEEFFGTWSIEEVPKGSYIIHNDANDDTCNDAFAFYQVAQEDFESNYLVKEL